MSYVFGFGITTPKPVFSEFDTYFLILEQYVWLSFLNSYLLVLSFLGLHVYEINCLAICSNSQSMDIITSTDMNLSDDLSKFCWLSKNDRGKETKCNFIYFKCYFIYDRYMYYCMYNCIYCYVINNTICGFL